MTELDDRIRRNLDRLTEGGASDAEIRTYLEHEGFDLTEATPQSGGEGLFESGGLISQTLSGPYRGAASILGFPGDVANAAAGLLGVEDPPFAGSERFQGFMSPFIAQAPPDTALERVLSRTGEEITMGAVPAAGLLRLAQRSGQAAGPLARALGFEQARTRPGRFASEELAAATAGGLAAGVATEVSDNPLVEFAAQLAGGAAAPAVGSGAERLYGLLPGTTEVGQRQAVGQAMADMATQPREAAAGIVEGLQTQQADGIPGLRPTTAELSGDPGLMGLQTGLASGAPIGLPRSASGAFSERRAINEAAFRDQILRTAPGDAAAVEQVTAGVQRSVDDWYRRQNEAWEAIDPDGAVPIPASQFREDFNAWTASLDPAEAEFIPASINRIVGRYGDEVTFSNLTNLRSRIGDEIRTRDRQGEYNEARILRQLREFVDGQMGEAAAENPEILARYQAARDVSREMHDTLDVPARAIVDESGMSPDRIMRRMLSNPDPVGRVTELQRILGNDPEAAAGLQRAFWDHFLRGTRTDDNAPLTAEGFAGRLRNFYRNPSHRDVAGILFTAEQRDNIERLRQWSEILARPRRAELGGSPTAQRLAAQRDVLMTSRRALTYLVGGPGASGAVTDIVGRMIGRIGQEGREELLKNALIDPQLGRDLLTEVTYQTERQVARRIHAHLLSVGLAPAEVSLEDWLEDQE